MNNSPKFKVEYLLLFLAFVLIGYEFYLLTNIDKNVKSLANDQSNLSLNLMNSKEKSSDDAPKEIPYNEPLVEYKGTLTILDITEPEEDTIYLLELEEPSLFDNQSGLGLLYLSGIQVTAPQHKGLEEYVGKKVKIAGRLNWGYAHARVLEAQDIIEL